VGALVGHDPHLRSDPMTVTVVAHVLWITHLHFTTHYNATGTVHAHIYNPTLHRWSAWTVERIHFRFVRVPGVYHGHWHEIRIGWRISPYGHGQRAYPLARSWRR
jgi:hypothetical protein